MWSRLGLLLLALVATGAAAAQPVSYVRFDAVPDSFLVVVDGVWDAPRTLGRGDSLALPAGPHALVVAARYRVDVERRVEVEPGRTAEVAVWTGGGRVDYATYIAGSSYPVLVSGYNVRVFTDEGSTIYVDGEARGTREARFALPPGRHYVEVRHAHAGRAGHAVVVLDGPPRLQSVDLFAKPARWVARALTVVPGAAQWYKNERVKGAGLLTVGGLLVGSALWSHARQQRAARDYALAHDAYAAARTEREALRLGDAMAHHHEEAHSAHRLRLALSTAYAGLTALNVFDALRAPKGGYRSGRSVDIILVPGSAGTSLGARVRF